MPSAWLYVTAFAAVLAGTGILVSLAMRVGKGQAKFDGAKEDARASEGMLGIVTGELRSVDDAVARLSESDEDD